MSSHELVSEQSRGSSIRVPLPGGGGHVTVTREQIERLRSLLGFGTVEHRRRLLELADEQDGGAPDAAA